jgi:hypothetical protein
MFFRTRAVENDPRWLVIFRDEGLATAACVACGRR